MVKHVSLSNGHSQLLCLKLVKENSLIKFEEY